MKKIAALIAAGICAAGIANVAQAHVSIGIGIGFPGYYAPAPVYVAPPPVVYAAPPVVYQQGYYAPPPPPPVVYTAPATVYYGRPVYYGGYRGY